MMNALKEYYEECLKPEWNWVKRHKVGYMIYLASCFIIGFMWSFIPYKLNERKYSKKNEEKES